MHPILFLLVTSDWLLPVHTLLGPHHSPPVTYPLAESKLPCALCCPRPSDRHSRELIIIQLESKICSTHIPFGSAVSLSLSSQDYVKPDGLIPKDESRLSVYGIYVSGHSRDVIGCFKSNRWLSRDVIGCWYINTVN